MAPGIKTGGRQKGTPNKITAALKEAILEAADLAGEKIKPGGGKTAYLVNLAQRQPNAFAALLGKVLPLTVVGDPENPLAVQVYTDDQRAAALMAFLARTGKQD